MHITCNMFETNCRRRSYDEPNDPNLEASTMAFGMLLGLCKVGTSEVNRHYADQLLEDP